MTLKIKDPGSALTHFIAMILALGASSPLIINTIICSFENYVILL